MSNYPQQGLTGVTPADLAWLTGNWTGTRGGDRIHECWSSLEGGALMGMFRWLKGETVWFYEFMTLEPEDDQALLRIKHFYPGLKGWEEKDEAVEFLLIQLREGEAVFLQQHKPDAPSLVYRLEDDGRLVCYFVRENKTPAPEAMFVYTRG